MKYSINEINKFKHDAYERYYFMKKQASQLRESWLLDLAATQALHKGGNQQSRHNALILHENKDREQGN